MKIAHKNLTVLVLLIMTILFGCTIYKTPRVEDAIYKNFEYEFSFQVPRGWHVQESMPKSPDLGLTSLFSKDFVVMLIHPQNNGMIILQADKSNEDILALGYNPDIFKGRLKLRIQEREKELITSNQIKNFSYEIGPLTVKQGYGPSFIYQESAQNLAGEKYVRSEFLNQCQKNCSCDIHLTLISKENDFQNNFQVFTEVSNSLKKVYQ
jgi:hypothetical protein